MKILLLDDDPFLLQVLRVQLRKLGFDDVAVFENAVAALGWLDDGPTVDVVFCDLQMPGMDGVEFLRHLVAQAQRPAVILLSGEDERVLQSAERLARAHRFEVLGAISKPIQLELLREILASHRPGPRDPTLIGTQALYAPDELRRGIADGELVNHYQPKVELATGRVVGVEALVRWRHPRDGLVYPDRFVGLAEEFHFIDELTCRVLREALQDTRRWRDAGHELNIAVNVSMANFARLDFPDLVTREADSAGVPASSLVLEVTESCLMSDLRSALDVLTRLRLKRVGLSIDDFGTGHSSLSQLRNIPFDELKLDRGFVRGAGRDPALRAIIESSLRLARELRMKTVAEGIEDRSDWEAVRAAGCEVGQGYFIARPMPAEEFAPWLERWPLRTPRHGAFAS